MSTEKPIIDDVAKPGTTPADPTSKPVIVGHSAPIADPMVSPVEIVSKPVPATTPEKVVVAAAVPQPVVSSTKSGRIVPLSSANDIQKDTNTQADKAVLDKAGIPKQEIGAQQARLAEIIDSGEYNVAINQKTSASSVRSFFITVLAIVLLGIIVLFVLTDLKVIDLGIKLPIHIFKQ